MIPVAHFYEECGNQVTSNLCKDDRVSYAALLDMKHYFEMKIAIIILYLTFEVIYPC